MSFLYQAPCKLFFAPGRGVLFLKADFHMSMRLLGRRYFRARPKGRSQASVTINQRLESAPKGGNIRLSLDAHGPGKVIRRAFRSQLIHEPKSPLSVRKVMLYRVAVVLG